MSWYFTKQQITTSPSRRAGISEAEESKLRKEGAKFIKSCSNALGLRYDTIATAVVFFHRFYMMESIAEYKKLVLACACVFLAGKVEETPKKARDILRTTRDILKAKDWSDFGEDPKEALFLHEKILLQRINFDLNVSHPYTHLLRFAKGLKGDKAKLQKLVQVAWNFINDSLVTTLCLQWEPEPAAVAFLYLAAKVSKHDLQGSAKKSWWLKFVNNVDQHDLEDICGIVLDSYEEDEVEKESLQIVTAAANVASSSLDRRKSLDSLNNLKQTDLATLLSSSLDPSLLSLPQPPGPLSEEQLLKQLFSGSNAQLATSLLTHSLTSHSQHASIDPQAVAQAKSTINNLLANPHLPIALPPSPAVFNNYLSAHESHSTKHSAHERPDAVPPPPKRPPPPPLPFPPEQPPHHRQPPPPPPYPHPYGHAHQPHANSQERAGNSW